MGPFASCLGCLRRPWAVHVVVGVFSLSMGLFGGLLGSSLGCSRRRRGVRVVLGRLRCRWGVGSSLGRSRCRRGVGLSWAVRVILELFRVVVGVFSSSLGHSGRPRVFALSLGCSGRLWGVLVVLGRSHRAWGVRVVPELFGSSLGRPWGVGVFLSRSCRLLGVVVILGPSALSLSPAPVRLACCVTLLASPFVLFCGRPCRRSARNG